jgi:beta-glucuronidase
MSRLLAIGALTLTLALGAGGIARAQGSVYAASPPKAGAWYRDGQSGRWLLGGAWFYRSDYGDVGLAQQWFADVAATHAWRPVTVPNAYNAGDFSTLSMTGYVGWYRRDFTLPASAFARYVPRSGQRWIIRFESVNYRARVWLNGRPVGTHTGADLPFEFDLGWLRPGVNRLIIRVDDRRTSTDLPPGPTGGWWNYGGLLREVYLRAVQRADIQQVLVRPVLSCLPGCPATIEDQAVIRNPTGAPQTVSLSGRYGTASLDFGRATIPPGGTWTAAAATVIHNPHLWSIDDPRLYRATLTLRDAQGRWLAGYTTYSGIRQIRITSSGGLELNGRDLSLRGVDLHEQDLTTGAALDPNQLQRLVGWVRALGATIIRSHYPLNPEILEMADRYGILIWSEIPVYQVSRSYFTVPGTVTRAYATLKTSILTNENHPSILLWSVGNELPFPPPISETNYFISAKKLARQLDPTRPIGYAGAVPCVPWAYWPLDVLGTNDYFGWFDSGGGNSNDRDALSGFLDQLRACYPSKALFVSEFGFDSNRHGPVEEKGTYEFQSNAAAFHLGVFATKPWLAGAMYWLVQDFAARPDWDGGNPWGNPPFVTKGLVDLQGNLKPAFATVQAIYAETTQIAPAVRRRRGQRGP